VNELCITLLHFTNTKNKTRNPFFLIAPQFIHNYENYSAYHKKQTNTQRLCKTSPLITAHFDLTIKEKKENITPNIFTYYDQPPIMP